MIGARKLKTWGLQRGKTKPKQTNKRNPCCSFHLRRAGGSNCRRTLKRTQVVPRNRHLPTELNSLAPCSCCSQLSVTRLHLLLLGTRERREAGSSEEAGPSSWCHRSPPTRPLPRQAPGGENRLYLGAFFVVEISHLLPDSHHPKYEEK